MAGKIRHLVNRSGRYHARLVVPKDLRKIVGKTELRTPLGGDYRQAIRLLPGAVAQLQHQIALAEREISTTSTIRHARYPLAPNQLALAHYQWRLEGDELARSHPAYAQISIDDLLVARLRQAIAGKLHDGELQDLVGEQIDRFRSLGNLTAERGSDEWRIIARAICSAELEALARAAERDEGDYSGRPTTPMLIDAQPPAPPQETVNLKKLWDDYKTSRTQAGFMHDGGKRQDPVIENLRKFLKHNDARRVTKKDLLAWRDHLMTSLSAKTVNDIYLSTVRSLFGWAHENERLPENVAATVKQPRPRKVKSREKGYTDQEALTVLTASINYQPKPNQVGYVRETPRHTAAKRWAPVICAFTGARISEITQLRKEDVRQEGDRWIIRITPDAGTVKTGGYRDVPLHRQIVDLGFIDYVNAASAGPLFHNATEPEKFATAASSVSDEISKWLRRSKVTPEGVQPNHGWRHRLKTKASELGIDSRVIDAIQGHAGRTPAHRARHASTSRHRLPVAELRGPAAACRS
jgi:integrase